MIRGEVHDENAWSLGGVAGHAGLFSTAHDLAILARTLLNGGRYGHARILEADTVRAMLVNENAEFPGDSHGLGFELDQRWYMDGLSTPVTFGHTGFTGTSVVIDPLSDSFVILLTNRVHPSRDWGSNNPARRAVARDLARAIAVRPIEGRRGVVLRDRRRPHGHPVRAGDAGRRADRSGSGTTPRPATTSSPSRPPPTAGRPGPRCRSRCARVPRPTARSPGSAAAAGTTPARRCREGDDVLVRWRYANDAANQGRGVYVDRVRVDGKRHRPTTATPRRVGALAELERERARPRRSRRGHQREPGRADGGLVGRPRRIDEPCLHAGEHRPGWVSSAPASTTGPAAAGRTASSEASSPATPRRRCRLRPRPRPRPAR